ncbi:MAG: cysteine hydrolase [Actinobacteria bacterium]|nr:cysteine hydrolase [Actinomycetota bacterium]
MSAARERMNDGLELDPRRTAMLTIDMQRMYLDPSVGAKTLPPDEARAVLDASCRLLEACRAIGVPVVHAYVERRPVEIEARVGIRSFTRSFRAESGAAEPDVPDRLDGSPQAELSSVLVRDGDIHVRSKKTSDCFYGTELDQLLARVIRPDTLVLLGINTETCLYATTFAASIRGYRPVVASDCVGSHRGPDNTWMALELLSRTIAWVLPSDAIVAKLRVGPAA